MWLAFYNQELKNTAFAGEDLLGLEIEGLIGTVCWKAEPSYSNLKTKLCSLTAAWIMGFRVTGRILSKRPWVPKRKGSFHLDIYRALTPPPDLVCTLFTRCTWLPAIIWGRACQGITRGSCAREPRQSPPSTHCPGRLRQHCTIKTATPPRGPCNPSWCWCQRRVA